MYTRTVTHLVTGRNALLKECFVRISLYTSTYVNSISSTMTTAIYSPFIQNVVKEYPVLLSWLNFVSCEQEKKNRENVLKAKCAPRGGLLASKRSDSDTTLLQYVIGAIHKQWPVPNFQLYKIILLTFNYKEYNMMLLRTF